MVMMLIDRGNLLSSTSIPYKLRRRKNINKASDFLNIFYYTRSMKSLNTIISTFYSKHDSTLNDIGK
jgi:hypothetical protein